MYSFVSRMRHVALAAAAAAVLAASPASARVAKGPWVQRLTSTSVEIRVEVDPPAPVTVELGLAAAALHDGGVPRVIESKETKALHAITVTGLDPSVRYPYTIRSKGEAAYAAFTTAPREGSSEAFRFLLYGDNRTDDSAHAAVVRAMAGVQSDFLVHTGDFVEDGASAHDWQTFFDIEAPLLRERCVFACIGNHELTDGSGITFARYFGAGGGDGAPMIDPGRRVLDPKQLDLTFRWSNARFFLVNSMVPYRTGPERAWLEKALADADAEAGLEWRIVVLHHGPWSSGPHGDNLYLQDANIPSLLKAHKVDIVFSGHDHIYERGITDGLPYIVSGGGGAPPYRVRAAKASSKKLESVRHFVEASVNQAAIAFRVVRVDGSTLERCSLRKGTGWDCDGEKKPSEIAPTSSAAAAPPPTEPAPAPAPSSRCACRAAGANGDTGSGAWPLGLAAMVGLAAFVRRWTSARRGAILR
jgi:predicted phosphodiesterase